jgi:hypothetical protein
MPRDVGLGTPAFSALVTQKPKIVMLIRMKELRAFAISVSGLARPQVVTILL